MDESAIKGLKLLELNDSDEEDIQNSRSTTIKGTLSTISVEGYDTSLQRYPVELALEKLFSPCGEIQNIYVPIDLEIGILKSVAFVRIFGEGVQEKALELSGTDMGGWTAIVKAAPWQKVFMDDPWYDGPRCAAAPETKTERVFVSGYDTSLPKIDLQMALYNHFSSCGYVTEVAVLCRTAVIYINGERCVDKALELSGRNMGVMTLVVRPVGMRSGNVRKRRQRCSTTGYTLPCILLEEEAKKKKKMEAEMNMENKLEKEKKIEKENNKLKNKNMNMMEMKKMKINMKKMKMKMMIGMEK